MSGASQILSDLVALRVLRANPETATHYGLLYDGAGLAIGVQGPGGQVLFSSLGGASLNTLLAGIDVTTKGNVDATKSILVAIGLLQATKAAFNQPVAPITANLSTTIGAYGNRLVPVQGTGIVITIDNDAASGAGAAGGDSFLFEPVNPAVDSFTVVAGTATFTVGPGVTADSSKAAGGIVMLDHIAADTWNVVSPKSVGKGPFQLFQSGVAVTPANDTNENTVATIALPALGPNAKVRISTIWSNTGGSSTQFRYRLNGTLVALMASNQAQHSFEFSFQNCNATNSQYTVSQSLAADGAASAGGSATTAAVQTNVPTTLTITGQKTTAGDALVLRSYEVIITDPAA